MGRVLYEVTYQLDTRLLIPFVVLLGFSMVAVKEFKEIRLKGSVKGHLFNVCVLPFSLIILIFVCCATVAAQVDMYKNIVVAYQEGQYETVEGRVENFVPMPYEGHAQETFQIDGVGFAYSDYSTILGYHNAKSHGGVVTGDGQNLTIRYVYYEPSDCNVIVYIEEMDSK